MQVHHGFDSLPHFTHPAVTVGSYDGMHCGHKALLDTTREAAHMQHGVSVVFTFEPHPRITLGTAQGLRLLTTLQEKIHLLGDAGIDHLVVIPFDRSFSQLAPDAFIRDYLVRKAGAETLVVGFNHRFGHDKEGSYDYLGHHGFGVRVVEVPECDVDAAKVSSTIIRQLIAAGELVRASRMLGHPYLLIGAVVSGCIRLDEPLKLRPPAGTYRVLLNDTPAVIAVDESQQITIRGSYPDGEAVLTF